MSDQLLKQVESKLDALITECQRLQKENAAFKVKEDNWLQERARLIEKNELAKTRVEAMIEHLKNLEAES